MLVERRIASMYQEYVVAHALERTALLEALRSRCDRAPTVLYPGSFIHVTPSFYFQHVVYVDRSDVSRDFFAQAAAVLGVVNGRKAYPQPPFIRFVHQDFTDDLPFPEGSFDVLLALYAGSISRSCARYLKPGGLLLTNNHHGDARDAGSRADLELVAVACEHRGKIRFIEDDMQRFSPAAGPDRRRSRSDPRADYFVFRKLGRTRRAGPADG